MSAFNTRKSSAAGRRETVARRQVRSGKMGAGANRAGRPARTPARNK